MCFASGVRGALRAALTLAVLVALPAGATEIWTGPMIDFTNLAGSDPTQPASQDQITLDVWLTRGYTRGLFNAALESGYTSLSPVGTEWAYGELGNYASLNYQTWVAWNGRVPPPWWGKTPCSISFPMTFTWPLNSPPGISAVAASLIRGPPRRCRNLRLPCCCWRERVLSRAWDAASKSESRNPKPERRPNAEIRAMV